MLARLVVVICQYIQISNHCTPETNKVLYINYISIRTKTKIEQQEGIGSNPSSPPKEYTSVITFMVLFR